MHPHPHAPEQKRICALTMVRNDSFFLERWVDYYARQLGTEHVYVLLDGHDQPAPAKALPENVFYYEHIEGNVAHADRGRIDIISDKAKELFENYDLVIGTDVDEFLMVDPACGKSLKAYLSTLNIRISVSGLGVDVGQHLEMEEKLDKTRPFLSQRRFAVLYTRYTKASVIAQPVKWGSGFHRVRKHNFKIDRNLYLFHFGSVDAEMIRNKFSDQEKIKNGWERHLNKRFKTILLVTNKKHPENEFRIKLIRTLQNILRPVFAWNKPGLWGWKPVTTIPARFRKEPLC